MSAQNFCRVHVCVIPTLTISIFSRIKLFSQRYSSKKPPFATIRNNYTSNSADTYQLQALMLRVVSSPDLPVNYSSPTGELAGLSPGCLYCMVGINVKAAVWSARPFLALSRATSLFGAIFEQSRHWQLRNGQAECTATLKLWALHLLQNVFMLHVTNGSDIMNFLARDNYFWLEKWRARNRQDRKSSKSRHQSSLAFHPCMLQL